ncbi:MAG: GNAT family N-acetyltransferase [Lachnospiraceae bacterium]|nr:GNAT family N-acetyltransferase [Lachnospiraceae bacterium]
MNNYRLVRLSDGEDERKLFRFAALGSDRKVLGELELFFEDGTAVIPMIYVDEKHRRQGVGSFLLQSVINELDDAELFTPLELRFVKDKATEGLEAFLLAQGNFSLEESDAAFFSVSPAQRKKAAKWKQMSEADADAEEFFSLDEQTRTAFYESLEQEEAAGFLARDEAGFDRRLCFAKLSGDRVVAAVFMEALDEDLLDVSFLYAQEKHPMALRSVLAAAINAVDELYSKATLQFSIVTPEGFGVIKGIFGDSLEQKSVTVARWDGLSEDGLQELGQLLGKSFA